MNKALYFLIGVTVIDIKGYVILDTTFGPRQSSYNYDHARLRLGKALKILLCLGVCMICEYMKLLYRYD